jgi:hypothetical protein
MLTGHLATGPSKTFTVGRSGPSCRMSVACRAGAWDDGVRSNIEVVAMSTIGGDESQLLALKTSFDRQAELLREMTATLRAQVYNTNWMGPSADRFRAAWSEEYERVLNRLAQALTEAGMEVGRYRDRLMHLGP